MAHATNGRLSREGALLVQREPHEARGFGPQPIRIRIKEQPGKIARNISKTIRSKIGCDNQSVGHSECRGRTIRGRRILPISKDITSSRPSGDRIALSEFKITAVQIRQNTSNAVNLDADWSRRHIGVEQPSRERLVSGEV